MKKPRHVIGDPLVVVMQIEELTNKVDLILEILKRVEERQKTTAMLVEEMEKTEGTSETRGTFVVLKSRDG